MLNGVKPEQHRGCLPYTRDVNPAESPDRVVLRVFSYLRPSEGVHLEQRKDIYRKDGRQLGYKYYSGNKLLIYAD